MRKLLPFILASCTAAVAAPTAAPKDPLGLCATNGGLGPSGICAASGTSLRVLTYNVNFALAGDADGIAAIASVHADIVLLQETNDAWQTALEARLDFPHRRFDAPRGWLAGGIGVMSRWPIETVDRLPSPVGPFDAWRIVVRTPRGPVQLLDVHLRPPMSDGGSWVVGYFSTRGDREREIIAYAAKLDPHLPTIVAGDFNEDMAGRAVAALRAHGFVDAIGRPDEPTWHWPLGRTELKMALDHVFHDNNFRAVASSIEHAGRSDHFPVWADLVPTR
jgi:endonuclease/exonuclease/phosphatase (EEP) superfamily protein YafD